MRICRIHNRAVWTTALLLGLACPVAADGSKMGALHNDTAPPTLARLSLWIAPEKQDAFALAYEQELLPLLQARALRPYALPGRATPDSIFSRLFAVETPKQVQAIALELAADPQWQQALRRLAAPDTTLRHYLRIYSTPAGAGHSKQVGAGTRQGLWQLFSAQDGLPTGWINALLQDRRGDLWIGTIAGLSRYDGERFTTYTIADGLVDDKIFSLVEDEQGDLWIGTGGGLSRYDGERFTTYAEEDGLGSFGPFILVELLQDRDGAIWVGSGSELSRYDGQTFKQPFDEYRWTHAVVRALFQDRRGIIWIGTEEGLSRYDGNSLTTFTTADGLVGNEVQTIAEDAAGQLWIGSWEGLSRYDGKTFATVPFFAEHGLRNYILSTAVDHKGNLWVGGADGLIRYDGQATVAFTARDGLGSSGVKTILEDRDGLLWFGTQSGGLLRYDGNLFEHFTTEEGLPTNYVFAVYQDRRGDMWFGSSGGLARYDGQHFETFTTADGLADSKVVAIRQDRRGDLWFGLYSGRETKGLSRYDGQHFETFTTADGLATNIGFAIYEDRGGRMWFGGPGVTVYDGQRFAPFAIAGVAPGEWTMDFLQDRQGNFWFVGSWGATRYDGQGFVRYSAADGLPASTLWAVFEDSRGQLYIGGSGGLSRYDGEAFTPIETPGGTLLKGGSEIGLIEDRRGQLWMGIYGIGVVRYDGRVFQPLSRRDGLLDDGVHDIIEDRNGDMWIASDGGVARYTPYQRSPGIRLTEIVADHSYSPDAAIAFTTQQDFVRFAFQGRSLLTDPDQMAYVYRLRGYDSDWLSAYSNQVEYRDLPAGDYVFEVKAVDRDLNYSPEPAAVQLRVRPPYGQIALLGGLGLALLGLALTSTQVVRRRRQLLREQRARLQAQEALNRELEQELQTARELQMSLMPTESPQIAGLDIAGHCQTVNHVGGDFFQYFEQNGKLSICLADVTGHAMEAAVPVMMFSGVLKTEMRHGVAVDQLFGNLNNTMHDALDSRTFVCFTMGELDMTTRTMRLANGGCPYPYHYRAATGEMTELEVHAFPLGVRAGATYPVVEAALVPGDYIVFCSDGIIEVANPAGDIFGFEQTAATIRAGCAEGLCAEALIDRLVGAVQAFAGDEPQHDDMTVVVLRVEA